VLGLGLLIVAQGAGADARELLERHFDRTTPVAKTLSIAAGATVMVEHRFDVPTARLRGLSASDLEAVVQGISAPAQLVVHPRADRFSLQPRGATTEVRIVVAIHATPSWNRGGGLRYAPRLIERRGLGNQVVGVEWTGRVTVDPPEWEPPELARAFYGWRLFRPRAVQLLQELRPRGVRIGLKDNGRIPPLVGARPDTLRRVEAFQRARRRMWMGRRTLVAAARLGPAPIADLARRYLDNLQRSEEDFVDLPSVAWLPTAGASAAGASAAPAATAAPSAPKTGTPDVLQPLTTYEVGSDRPSTPTAEAVPEAETEAATTVPEPDPVPVAEPSARAPSLPPPEPESDRPTIPAYGRGLTLDDPNVAFGGSVRWVLADATIAQGSATTSVLFFTAQAALTSYLGLEVVIPTQYVDLDDIQAQSVFTTGNPLLAAKVRLHLPPIEGRRPALTLRARYGIPASPPSQLAPTDLEAESFSREVHFVDTYAFFADLHDVGLGANIVWRVAGFQVGAQTYLDYFFPVGAAEDLSDFVALSYGMGVGYYPLRRDWVAAFGELRAVSLLQGGGRTNALTYLGARGRLFEWFEPAVFVGIPVGSIADSSSVQLGVELRFSYDREPSLPGPSRSFTEVPR
jgi:hypothetical protein